MRARKARRSQGREKTSVMSDELGVMKTVGVGCVGLG